MLILSKRLSSFSGMQINIYTRGWRNVNYFFFDNLPNFVCRFTKKKILKDPKFKPKIFRIKFDLTFFFLILRLDDLSFAKKKNITSKLACQ